MKNNLFAGLLMKKNFPCHFLLLGILSLELVSCSSSKSGGSSAVNSYDTRCLLLRDEGKSQLSYIDIANPAKNWYVAIPPGRDIQLVGNGEYLSAQEMVMKNVKLLPVKKYLS